jgi:STE24 endopeptidase
MLRSKSSGADSAVHGLAHVALSVRRRLPKLGKEIPMQKYQVILLTAFLIVQGIEYWLKYINLQYMKRYGSAVPESFKGYIDEKTLKKSHAYTIENDTFSLVESLFGNIVLLAFIFGGLLRVYDSWTGSLGLPFVARGVVFFLVLSYVNTLLSVPFSLYDTFRIENKYGFNKMTFKLWLADTAKSTGISTLLIGIILGIGFWIVQASPGYWWLFIWGFFFVFSLFMMYISPYVIEPLFNKFTPLGSGALEGRIREMMKKAGIKVSRVFKIDASRRSHHTNAYFTGIGKVKRIILYDTLMEKMDDDEILSILAHEAGHWKKKHVVKMIAAFELVSLAGAYIAFRVLKTDFFSIFGFGEGSFFAKLIVLGFIFSIVSFPFTPLFSLISRRHENQADGFAVGLSPNPESLASSLIKLSKDNLSNLHPHPLYAAFHYSHPPVVERVKRIEEMAGRSS